MEKFDDLSSIPCPGRGSWLTILLSFDIWIGGVLDKRDRQVRHIDKRVC